MDAVMLKTGRERSLLRRHPWVFSGAVDALRGDPAPGETVDVLTSDGTWIGRGAFSPQSQITVRMWTFDVGESVDDAFFVRRVAAAVAARKQRWNPPARSAVRLLHGESDGLPGVVVDRYADVLVAQFLTTGAERWKGALTAALLQALPGCSVYERSDAPSRVLEGLAPVCCGLLAGAEPPERIDVRWAGLAFAVDVRGGHKTGAYLDQADTIARVGALATGGEVLDCFCYTGGFTLSALAAGAARVASVDSSADALAGVARQIEANGLDASRSETHCADVFEALRGFRDRGRSFDLIVLDPPKFADSKGHVERACRAYKDINLLAFKLLRPGGRLATFSCSGSVEPDLFQKVVADAALDACRFARMLERYTQAEDHPVSLAFPEGFYLKGLLCDVLG
jgi:23S rRNA (cytosine1962-C5)-methyltransferase